MNNTKQHDDDLGAYNIRNRCCLDDAIDREGAIQYKHKRNVENAFTQDGQNEGFSAFANAINVYAQVEKEPPMVRKCTDITELTAEIIRSFMEKIDVMKPEKVPGIQTKKQTIHSLLELYRGLSKSLIQKKNGLTSVMPVMPFFRD